MSIIPGKYAMVSRSNPTRYQEGVFFLARMIQQILSFVFFYQRITEQLTSGTLSGLEIEQVRHTHIALHSMIVIDLHKLVDHGRNNWSFMQLFKEWEKYEHDQTKLSVVKDAIEILEKKLESLTTHRHNEEAHLSKKGQMSDLTTLPTKINNLQEIVNVMDMFVASPIPYSLYVHDTSEEINLRDEMNLI